MKEHAYTTEHVWTFHIWQHAVDLAAYKLAVIFKPSLIQYLDGQPLAFLAMLRGSANPPSYLWKFDVWHRDLLPAHEAWLARHPDAAPQRSAPKLARASAGDVDRGATKAYAPPGPIRNEPSLAHHLSGGVGAASAPASPRHTVTWKPSESEDTSALTGASGCGSSPDVRGAHSGGSDLADTGAEREGGV